MHGWEEFVCASVVFLIGHSLPARPAMRLRFMSWIGRRAYLTLYSAISLALLAWVIIAAGRAPYVGLWAWSPERVWLTNLLMAVALVLAVCGSAIANPISLGGVAGKVYDPIRPGILAVTCHPLLWALAFWSLAHLLANGDLAHVVLFAAMGAFSLLGVLVMERRARLHFGPGWRQLATGTSLMPFCALVTGRARWSPVPVWRLAMVPAVWAALIVLHRPVLGVSPLPPL